MTQDESVFVEEIGQFLAGNGMTPMAGRMWGWLLICDPPEQTASQLAHELHASRGAISSTARMLATASLIRRTRRRGDRREYFTAPPGALVALLTGAGAGYRRIREITEDGLAIIADRPPASRARLQEMHDAYAFFEREYPALIERYLAGRDGARPRPQAPQTPAAAPETLPA